VWLFHIDRALQEPASRFVVIGRFGGTSLHSERTANTRGTQIFVLDLVKIVMTEVLEILISLIGSQPCIVKYEVEGGVIPVYIRSNHPRCSVR